MKKILTILSLLSISLTNCYSSSYKHFNQEQKIERTSILKHNEKLELSVIMTGYTSTPEFLIYQGGGLKEHTTSFSAIYIKHPKGDILFDTGLGTMAKEQQQEMSLINRNLFKFKDLNPIIKQLKENNHDISNVKNIILSHMHWDHASGLKDFPNTNIFADKNEFEFAITEDAKEPAFIKSQYSSIENQFKNLEFKKEKFLLFDEICDFYNDGSLILVKLDGHTKGSVGLFIKTQSNKILFFVGDLIWTVKQLKENKGKNVIASKMVDYSPEMIRESIKLINAIKKYDNNIQILPAHDYNVLKKLAIYPKFQK
ncbi:MAG: MBL fold metallo-hydrolase [Candidatus Sericytochromatia bacterium]